MRIDVRINDEGHRLIDQQLIRVEVTHQERDGVLFLIGHPREVLQVLAELNLVGEPRVGYRLVVQVVGPLIADRLQQQTLVNSGSKDRKGTRLNSSPVAISYAVC